MSKRVYVIRNKKTEKEYTVDEAGWEAIKRQKGFEARFRIVSERVATEPSKKSFIPDEIREKAATQQSTEANTDRAARD